MPFNYSGKYFDPLILFYKDGIVDFTKIEHASIRVYILLQICSYIQMC